MENQKKNSLSIAYVQDEAEMLYGDVQTTRELNAHILSFFDKTEGNVSEKELRYIYNIVYLLLRVEQERLIKTELELHDLVERSYESDDGEGKDE